MTPPTREEVLEGLRRMREDVGTEPRRAAEAVRDEGFLDRAIAYLEGLPSRCLEAEQAAWFRGAAWQLDALPADKHRYAKPADPRGCR